MLEQSINLIVLFLAFSASLYVSEGDLWEHVCERAQEKRVGQSRSFHLRLAYFQKERKKVNQIPGLQEETA